MHHLVLTHDGPFICDGAGKQRDGVWTYDPQKATCIACLRAFIQSSEAHLDAATKERDAFVATYRAVHDVLLGKPAGDDPTANAVAARIESLVTARKGVPAPLGAFYENCPLCKTKLAPMPASPLTETEKALIDPTRRNLPELLRLTDLQPRTTCDACEDRRYLHIHYDARGLEIERCDQCCNGVLNDEDAVVLHRVHCGCECPENSDGRQPDSLGSMMPFATFQQYELTMEKIRQHGFSLNTSVSEEALSHGAHQEVG